MAIKVILAGNSGIVATVQRKQVVLAAELGTVWDASTTGDGGEQDLFVDAKDDEILPYVDWTWAKKIATLGRGANYPLPTGIESAFQTGDDQWIESNVFTAAVRGAEALKAKNTLVDHVTLKYTNEWGTLDRFTDTLGGQDYANDLVEVHDLRVMICRRILAQNLSWGNCVSQALGSDFGGSQAEGGFNNWFLPNVNQVSAVMKRENNGSANHCWKFDPFETATSGTSFTSSGSFRMALSTTFPDNTANAMWIEASAGVISWGSAKTSAIYDLWIMRKM